MTIGKEVKDFLDSITAMVSGSNDEIVSVTAHVADASHGVDRKITYAIDKGAAIHPGPIITPLDVYHRLWNCRKFEIELVWKRAAFISAFVISCFTAYGFILAKILSAGIGKCPIYHSLATIVASFGFLMATLWIAMAKGSKAWQEVYEQAIIAWGQTYCKSSGINNWEGIVAGKWWMIPGYENRERKWWGMCGGNFSVSSINILLGFLFALVWIGMIIVHGIVLIKFCPPMSTIHVVMLLVAVCGEFLLSGVLYFWLATSATLKKEAQPLRP